MVKPVLFLLVATALLVLPMASVEAKQPGARRGGSDVVVHDRLAPVVAHRLVPPYYGKHVYSRGGR